MQRLWFLAPLALLLATPAVAQGPHPVDPRLLDIRDAVSAGRVEADIRALASFHTRHTLSDTTEGAGGIGDARRWIREQFLAISAECGGCLEVVEQRTLVPAGTHERIPFDVEVVNEYAVIRGTRFPERYVIMSGDIDSRISDPNDFTGASPGANDNASGMAGAIEAARVLSQYAGSFGKSVLLAGLSGEEQDLFGGQHLAQRARDEGWVVEAVLNNDMIGNIAGIDGVVANDVFRVFSEPFDRTLTGAQLRRLRYFGGEVDGPSRQLARYVAWSTEGFFDNLEPMLVYRLDRWGRGGHHTPFNDAGFPAVRIMEAHEHYDRQHQDLRVEDGRHYGDTIEYVDFGFAARMTAVNAVVLAQLAWAPPPPANATLEGAVRASATLRWERVPGATGYRVHWRRTTDPRWTHSRDVGDVEAHEFTNMVVDNWLFGVSSVGPGGHASVVAFPAPKR